MLIKTLADPDDSGRHTFREKTQRLFEAIVVIYSAVFQKATTVARTKDVGPQVFEEDRELYAVYQRAWRALPEFCKSLPNGHFPDNETRLTSLDRPTSDSPGFTRRQPFHRFHCQQRIGFGGPSSPEVK